METNANKLKGAIIARGKTVEEVAKAIGMDKATFYRRLKQFGKFTIDELLKIKEVLNLSEQESIEIFLIDYSLVA